MEFEIQVDCVKVKGIKLRNIYCGINDIPYLYISSDSVPMIILQLFHKQYFKLLTKKKNFKLSLLCKNVHICSAYFSSLVFFRSILVA